MKRYFNVFMKKNKEIETYNPWGKVGGGAPLRDEYGRIVSNVQQFKKKVTNQIN
jgi:hypothetical protein